MFQIELAALMLVEQELRCHRPAGEDTEHLCRVVLQASICRGGLRAEVARSAFRSRVDG